VSWAARFADADSFLRMAWFANPFSCAAINTVIPLIPYFTERLSLSTGMAGIVCSLWMFARLGAFVAFWQWAGWYYRFRWLAGSFVLMIVCFPARRASALGLWAACSASASPVCSS